jgi:hypothetical protein
MTDVEAELRKQFLQAIESADYPVEEQTDIVTTLPDGIATRFEAGEFSMTAAGIAAELYAHQDFPYETPEELADDLITGLKAEELL